MKHSRTRSALLALVCVSLTGVLGGCSRSANEAGVSAAEIQALVKRVQHLEDVTAIQKLQSSYVHRLFTQRFESIPDLYSRKAPDVSVEFSDSGVFKGHDSVTRLYNAFGRTREIPGFFILHMAVDPYIEIAADGQSAKSHWLSPGATNSPSGSSWVWGPYYVDYVKEDGEWKILHSNLLALFRNPYQYSWGESPHHGTVNVSGMLGITPDAPPSMYRPFNEVKKEKDIFRNHPQLPVPY
ncbi:MAG: nuclear transport factor 2 family protein [Pseudomonadota bacterium]